MSDKKKHKIKHYLGTLVLSKPYSVGFISLFSQETGECSYIIVKGPNSNSLECRMAMVLTLSSIDRHRRACSEKMLITKNLIPENSKTYNALKALLRMNDSFIRITNTEYSKLLQELQASDSIELQRFAERYPNLSTLANSSSTIDTCEYIMIPESTIKNLKFLSPVDRDSLHILMRKHSIANWYYKANNKNAEDIFNFINQEL